MNYRAPGQEELATKVGSTRPTFRRVWKGKSPVLRFFAPFEYWTAWFFFLFNNVALFRFGIEAVAAGALIVTVVGVYGEFQQRQTDRGVRVATLFAQIAQIHALPDGKGLRALKAGVEALAREDVPMTGINLSGAKLRGADLSGADLIWADLIDADLIEADLSGADLSGADLSDADLIEADLSSACLVEASLIEANLSDADLIDADLSDADLIEADLSDADLIDADLRGANLRGANLRGASLSGANLRGANLIDADLRGANLRGANLRGASLSGADLREASLSGADLREASLSGADLRTTINLSEAQLVVACARPDAPPLLPASLLWKENPCPQEGEGGGEGSGRWWPRTCISTR